MDRRPLFPAGGRRAGRLRHRSDEAGRTGDAVHGGVRDRPAAQGADPGHGSEHGVGGHGRALRGGAGTPRHQGQVHRRQPGGQALGQPAGAQPGPGGHPLGALRGRKGARQAGPGAGGDGRRRLQGPRGRRPGPGGLAAEHPQPRHPVHAGGHGLRGDHRPRGDPLRGSAQDGAGDRGSPQGPRRHQGLRRGLERPEGPGQAQAGGLDRSRRHQPPGRGLPQGRHVPLRGQPHHRAQGGQEPGAGQAHQGRPRARRRGHGEVPEVAGGRGAPRQGHRDVGRRQADEVPGRGRELPGRQFRHHQRLRGQRRHHPLQRQREEQRQAEGRRHLPDRQRRAVPRRHHRHHAHRGPGQADQAPDRVLHAAC